MKKRDFWGQILGNAVKKFTQRVSGITMVFQNKKNQLISSKNVGRKAIIYVTQWCSIRFRATIDPITCRELAASPTQQPASLNDIKDKDKKTKHCTKSPPTPPPTYPSPFMSLCWIDIIIWARACIAVHQDWSCASQMHTRTDSALSDLTCVLPTFAEPLPAAKKYKKKVIKMFAYFLPILRNNNSTNNIIFHRANVREITHLNI